MKTRILLLIASIIIATPVISQCLQYEVPLQQRVQSSSLIIEGEVVGSTTTWDQMNQQIYTVHKVLVNKFFKGTTASTYVEIVTEGGLVGNVMQVVRPSLELEPGQQGIFLLDQFADVAPQFGGAQVYMPVSSQQGFILFAGTSASDPFHEYPSISQDLYPTLQSLTGGTFTTVQSGSVRTNQNRSSNRRAVPPVINSFSPNPITAGTGSVLTITGSNFGTNTGPAKVQFANADNGGFNFITAAANHIQSWTSTEIKLTVPSGAGTGKIRVYNDLGDSTLSSNDLTVTYNLSNLTVGGSSRVPDLVNINGSGGYTLQYNVNFDNYSNATAAFERAVETWRCGTGLNFEIGITPTDSACNRSDGINTITWDTACGLPPGVLGQSSTFFDLCFSGGITVYLTGTDIRFTKNPGAGGWYFGTGTPGPSQFDFESVALHELGHSHQLGHIIALGKVMHYTISAGTQQRMLDPASDEAAGNDVMSRSATTNNCGPGPISPVSLSNCLLDPLSVSFDAFPKSGCAPLTVIFQDQSGGNPNSWMWDIDNDGSYDYNIKNPIHVYNQPGFYSVKLKITSATGTDSLVKTNFIAVGPPPTADAGPDQTICPNGSVMIGGNPTGSGGSGSLVYNWSPSTGLDDPNGSNPIASPQVTTTYIVTVTDDDFNCSTTDTVEVVVGAGPTADAGPGVEVCENNSVTVGGSPSGSGGTGTLSYHWSPGSIFDDSTEANPMASPLVTVIATLTVTDQLGCSDQDTVTITVLANPRANAGADQTVCAGNGATIGGSPAASGGAGGYTYLWQPFGGLNNSGAANPIANPSQDTRYTLTVFDALGCSAVDSMDFDVAPIPIADAGVGDTICEGLTYQLGGAPTASGGTPPYTYNWTPATFLNNPSIANPMASPTSSVCYTVVVTDANGCFAMDSVCIEVVPAPTVDAGADTSLCGGGGLITIGGNPTAMGNGPFTYLWAPSGIGITGPNPTVNPTASTTYSLTVTDANGCTSSDLVTVFISAGVRAYISGVDSICQGDCAVLQAQPLSGTPPFSYSWNTGAANNPITVCPTSTTTYSVTVSDGAGCSHDTSKTVTVLNGPPAEIIGLDTTYCETDDAVTISVSPSGGVISGPGVSGSQFDPATAGIGVHVVKYELTSANGCVGTDSVIIEVFANPPKPTITLLNDTLFTAGGFAGYKWIINGVPIANATDTFFHVTSMGDYAVEVSNANGCTNRSDDLFVDPTGIDLLSAVASIEVYPNPATDLLWIRIDAEEAMEPTIRLVSINGSVVFEEVQPSQASHLIQVPILRFAAGLYLLEIRAEQGSKWLRVVVE